MNLLTPLAGFLIGYGGIMGYQVIDSTYKGEMPGPKSFGYFIGGMTLLSAATIYALGRTDKVFNAGGLSQFTPNELTQSSAIHGDFDHASLNYSGHQNMILRAESEEVTEKDTEYWLGSSNTVSEAIEVITSVANGEYKPENLKEDILSIKEFYNAEGDAEHTNNLKERELNNFRDYFFNKFGKSRAGGAYIQKNRSGNPYLIITTGNDDGCSIGDLEEDYDGYMFYELSYDAKRKLDDAIKQFNKTLDVLELYVKRIEQSEKAEKFGMEIILFMRTKAKNGETFGAEGNYNDFIEDMEGVMGKYGEMKDFDSGYNPQDNLLKARMVVEVDDEDFGDVDFDAEMMMPEKQCVICGGPYTGYGHNPEPIFPMSRGRCCDVCNATVVIPYRLGGMNFRFGEDFEAQGRDVMGRFVKWNCDLCGGKDEVGYVDEDLNLKVCEHCDVDGSDYDPKLWEAQTTRKHRYNLNRFNKTKRPNRTGTGVKRKFWQDLFAKAAEDMPDELDMVMAQLYEIEDMKNPTPEDLTNYQNLLTRYYEIVSFNAEQKTARVRTMSGKPVSETLRKLKQDKNLSAKDARTRKEIKAEDLNS